MKKIGFIFLTLLAFRSVAQEKHVVLISIDGLRPEFYLDNHWPTTHIKTALKNGAYADGVNSVFPSVTYPSHTAMITGVTPLKHGIYYNTPAEPLGVTGEWNWYYDKIKVPTIFTAAKNKQLKTASVFWPVSVGSIADYTVPEFWYLPKSKTENRDVIKALEAKSSPSGYWDELVKNATGAIQPIDFDGDYFSIDEINTRIACYTLREHKPNFMSLHLVTVDHFEHEQGREGDKVNAAIAVVDHAVKQLMEAADKAGILENTTFLITGDHGFVNIHTTIHPNVWLTKAGLYDPKHPANWKAYFHSSGGATFLLLKNPKDVQTLKKVEQIIAKLPEENRKLFVIKNREALDKIGATTESVLALTAMQGYAFGNHTEGNETTPAKGGTHGYFPDFKEIQTGFAAFGAGIKPGAHITEMNLTDIAAIVAKLLQLDMPGIEGKVPEGLLKQ